MQAVDVLGRIDALGDLIGIDGFGQRQLHQDAVDRGIGIQAIDQRQQLALRRRRRQVVGKGDHADRVGHPALVAYVDLRCGILANENDGEPRWPLARSDARGNLRAHLGRQPLCAGPAVDDARAHPSSWKTRAV